MIKNVTVPYKHTQTQQLYSYYIDQPNSNSTVQYNL
jgi:hypothetical protein